MKHLLNFRRSFAQIKIQNQKIQWFKFRFLNIHISHKA